MTCPICGKEFYDFTGGRPMTYCSLRCRDNAANERRRLMRRRARLAKVGFGKTQIEHINQQLSKLGALNNG